MNFTKIVFGVALTAFCLISLSDSLKCYVCNSINSCKTAKLSQCDAAFANNTRSYLQRYHTGVNNGTSKSYDCFREYLNTTIGATYYKGCAYSNANNCRLPLSISATDQHCIQCNTEGCNPAGRPDMTLTTLFTTIIIAFILRYI